MACGKFKTPEQEERGMGTAVGERRVGSQEGNDSADACPRVNLEPRDDSIQGMEREERHDRTSTDTFYYY